jgi:hypothetical protein
MTTTASIYYNSINVNFPVPGQDNSSQGFRDNFSNTQMALEDVDNRVVDLELMIQYQTYFVRNVPYSATGSPGDTKGMMYANTNSVYLCFSDYIDNSTKIWIKLDTASTSWTNP